MKMITISSKNQVVIPKLVRSKLRLSGGDQLIIARLTKDEVVLKKAPSYYDLLGIVKPGVVEPVARIRKLREDWR